MATISILANTLRPSVNPRSDDTAFRAGTFSWQDQVHSWKAGPGEVMTVENLLLEQCTTCTFETVTQSWVCYIAFFLIYFHYLAVPKCKLDDFSLTLLTYFWIFQNSESQNSTSKT